MCKLTPLDVELRDCPLNAHGKHSLHRKLRKAANVSNGFAVSSPAPVQSPTGVYSAGGQMAGVPQNAPAGVYAMNAGAGMPPMMMHPAAGQWSLPEPVKVQN